MDRGGVFIAKQLPTESQLSLWKLWSRHHQPKTVMFKQQDLFHLQCNISNKDHTWQKYLSAQLFERSTYSSLSALQNFLSVFQTFIKNELKVISNNQRPHLGHLNLTILRGLTPQLVVELYRVMLRGNRSDLDLVKKEMVAAECQSQDSGQTWWM